MRQTTDELRPINWSRVRVRIFAGAVIGLAVSLFFVLGADHPSPDWPALWQVKPLVIIPLAGACGGGVAAYLDHETHGKSWQRIAAMVLSLVVFLVGLWLGVVLGLNGTMWD